MYFFKIYVLIINIKKNLNYFNKKINILSFFYKIIHNISLK